jgi:TetR/AcrR family transcriptional repressor of nem operon
MKLLLERGYRRVRLEEVAVDAGVSKATVYHYFANKDDLLTQSLSERMAEKQAAIEQRIAEVGGRAEDRLRAFLRQFWSFSLTPQAGLWHRMLTSEIVTEAPDVYAAWARGIVLRWRTVERLVRDGQRAGEFRANVDPEVAARFVISALSYQALFHVHFGMKRFAPYHTDRLFNALVKQFIDGIRVSVRRTDKS